MSVVPGDVLASRYEILSRLGQGGMGVVYKARDRTLSEIVAIKVLRSEAAESPDMTQRFLSEIKLARTVSHKNVCRIHEYGEDPSGLRYISMAFVDGEDLKQVLQRRGPLPADEAYGVAIAVCEGLQAIHDEGIVHRDLKTPNIILDSRGVVRLMDFGIAKQWAGDTSAALTQAGNIIGTPEYMSPEQVRGEKLDARSDIYAMGIVIYELFTGGTLFKAETPLGVLFKHLQEEALLDSPEAARIPPPLVPVLRTALAKDRKGRFPTALDLAAALRRALAQSDPAASHATGGTIPPPGPSATTVRPAPTADLPTQPVGPKADDARPPTEPTMVPPKRVPAARPPAAPSTEAHRQPAPTRSIGYVLLAGAGVVLVGSVALILWGRVMESGTPVASLATPPAQIPLTEAPALPPPQEIPSPAGPASEGARAPRVERRASEPPPPATTLAPRPAAGSQPAAPATRLSPATQAELAGLLAEAESAFTSRQYETALRFYDEALNRDPRNERARIGRDLCAQALARPTAKSFVAGRTSAEGGAEASGPRGFEESAGVVTRRVAAAAPLPGKIVFEVQPEAVKPADAYTVKVYFVNEGAAGIQISDIFVQTTANGKSMSGSLRPLVSAVAPHERALLLSVSDYWKTETASWSMSVTVRTSRSETYTSEVRWQ